MTLQRIGGRDVKKNEAVVNVEILVYVFKSSGETLTIRGRDAYNEFIEEAC